MSKERIFKSKMRLSSKLHKAPLIKLSNSNRAMLINSMEPLTDVTLDIFYAK